MLVCSYYGLNSIFKIFNLQRYPWGLLLQDTHWGSECHFSGPLRSVIKVSWHFELIAVSILKALFHQVMNTMIQVANKSFNNPLLIFLKLTMINSVFGKLIMIKYQQCLSCNNWSLLINIPPCEVGIYNLFYSWTGICTNALSNVADTYVFGVSQYWYIKQDTLWYHSGQSRP